MTVEQWLGENNQLGIDIWNKKYKFNNETFDEWLNRISNNNEELKQLIIDKKFLFGGRILSNRGTDFETNKTSLSNCYVISPPEDNIESIYETCKKLARTYSYGGGCGIDISKLAPAGAKVRNQAKATSGAVSFMDTFSQVTEQIGQNGRRGALMISMRCDHPDIEKFITIKSDLNRVNYANISVMVTDDFMKAVERDDMWELKFTRPETGEVNFKLVRAKELFKLLCEQNWNYAEPGILFWDTIEQNNLLNTNSEFHYAGTNPCAEEPLPAGGSCLLGSLNLAAFVKNGVFDMESFTMAVCISVEALNDVLDEGLIRHPLMEQQNTVSDWRQIGLGVMGIADCLIKLGLRYGSEESINMCDQIGLVIAQTAIITSSLIAANRGSYAKYDINVLDSNFFKKHKLDSIVNTVKQNGLRNSQLLTIAPTGSISTMLGISGGIEPIFANYYERTTKSLHNEDVTYKVYTPIVKEYMESHNIKDDKDLPSFFVTSADLKVEERIAMQSIWQSHIDASISSTVNLPQSATVEDVENIYMSAWKQGLKGITIFRAGCARTAILNASPKKEEKLIVEGPKRGEVLPSSDDVIGVKKKLTTGCGSLHLCAYYDPATLDLREVYLSKGSTGGCQNYMIGLSRLISLAARAGVSLDDIVDQLMSTGSCPSYTTRTATKHDTSKGSCCAMAIGYALRELQEVLDGPNGKKQDKKKGTIHKCPECGEPLIFEGGCNICKSCGWTKCD